MSERTCHTCAAPIIGKRRDARYCSENCRKRRWDREEYRKPCADCAVLIDAHSERCAACDEARRTDEHEALLARIERMWNDGVSMRGIAAALGRTGPHTVGSEIVELRQAGRIGYRYKAYEERAA